MFNKSFEEEELPKSVYLAHVIDIPKKENIQNYVLLIVQLAFLGWMFKYFQRAQKSPLFVVFLRNPTISNCCLAII